MPDKRLIIIISCGQRKRAEESKACDLYTGPYFRAQLAFARSRVPDDQIFILSAKYGLCRLDEELEPYNIKMGDVESIAVEHIRTQAEDVFEIKGEDIAVLGGKQYVAMCRKVFGVEIETPLAGRGGIGKQIAWLRRMAKANH